MRSFFFIVTVFVGCADLIYSPEENYEYIMVMIFLFIGIMLLSFATGALTNYIESKERQNEKYEEKMGMLDKLFKMYKFPI